MIICWASSLEPKPSALSRSHRLWAEAIGFEPAQAEVSQTSAWDQLRSKSQLGLHNIAGAGNTDGFVQNKLVAVQPLAWLASRGNTTSKIFCCVYSCWVYRSWGCFNSGTWHRVWWWISGFWSVGWGSLDAEKINDTCCICKIIIGIHSPIVW